MSLWWLALYRPPEDSPAWLMRAQSVCFGTNENGLPDTYGWMLLVLAPLSFLSAILVVMGKEFAFGIRLVFQRSIGKVFLLSFSGLIVFGIVWATDKIQNGLAIAATNFSTPDSVDFPDSYPESHQALPDFQLQDQHATVWNPSLLTGNVVILTFAFAHCTTVCPALVQTSLSALRDLTDSPVKLLIITLDPWRDTPASLPTLAKMWQLPKNAHILSGEVEEVQKVLEAFHVDRTRNENTGDIIHPALVYLIKPDGSIVYLFNNPSKKWLHQATVRILRSNKENQR